MASKNDGNEHRYVANYTNRARRRLQRICSVAHVVTEFRILAVDHGNRP